MATPNQKNFKMCLISNLFWVKTHHLRQLPDKLEAKCDLVRPLFIASKIILQHNNFVLLFENSNIYILNFDIP